MRHALLPYLESEFNPAVRMSLARTLDLLNEEKAPGTINGAGDSPAFAAMDAMDGVIELDAYEEMSLANQRLLLWRELLALGLRPSFRLIEDLRANVCAGRSGNRMDLPRRMDGGARIREGHPLEKRGRR